MGCGLILNRRCALCGQRYGDHRAKDDACPSASYDPSKFCHARREFRKTKFQAKRRAPSLHEEGEGKES